MSTLNEYYNEIRRDIAKDFGLEAGGYGFRSHNTLPIHIAIRISQKYPSVARHTPHPKGVLIAKRYLSLVMGVK